MDHLIDDNDRLKPCPFCGGEVTFDHDDNGWNWVECLACGASTNARVSAMDDCKQLLLEQWNKRVPPACGCREGECESKPAGLLGAQPAPSVPEGVSFMDTSQSEGVVSTELVHSYPPPSGWLRAIDEALVVTHLGVANASDTYEQAKAKLDSLIGFHVDIAIEPAVNGGWKLVPIEPTKEMTQRACADHGYPHGDPDVYARGYRSMLDAAPEAKP